MADDKQVKKGMRTFASDLERVKNKQASKKVQSTSTPSTPKKKPSKANKSKGDKKSVKQVPPVPAPAAKVPKAPAIPVPKDIQDTLSNAVKEAVASEGTATQVPAIPKPKPDQALAMTTPTRSVGGGTIITDTKDDGFSLLPAIGTSIDKWVKGLTKKKKKKTPRLAVPETSRRKGVIQAATTKTGTIFTADSDTLKERIKARQRAAEKIGDEPETIWTPNTDPGFALLEGEHPDPTKEEAEEPADRTENVAVAFKKRATPTLTITPTPDGMYAGNLHVPC